MYDPFEEKLIDISQRRNMITIKFQFKNIKNYDFQNSEELVGNILKNLRGKFKPVCFAVMKCGFSIENYQHTDN